MIDSFDHSKSPDEESVTVEEISTIPEDSRRTDHHLRLPADDEPIEGTASPGEKELAVFCQTGLLPVAPADRPARQTELIPAILHPYLGTKRFRRPWPLLLSQSRSGFHIVTLSSVVDSLIEAVEEGDGGELQKRALFRLEQRIAEASNLEPVIDLRTLLDEITPEFRDDRADRNEAGEGAILSLLPREGEDSRVIGYGEAGLRELMVSVSARISEGRQRAFREDVESLAMRLGDLLRVDEEDSEQGHTPERLEKSVGGAYAGTIDFASLSHLLDEAPHGAAIESDRKTRIERTLNELVELSAGLFSENSNVCFQSFENGHRALSSRVYEFTSLVRAMQIARLEIENRYRPEIHDDLFEAFEYESIPLPDRKAFPPVIIHVHVGDAEGFEGFDLLLRSLGESGTVRLLITFSEVFDERAQPVTVLDAAMAAVARGEAFVQQSAAANATFVANGIQLSARSRGDSVHVVYTGSDSEASGIDRFMSAALAADSRTVPAFRFDPELGKVWADRFSAGENEQPESSWASEAIEVKSGASIESRTFSTTPADVLAIDLRFSDLFLVVAPSVQSPDFLELTEYLDLEETARTGRRPFVWLSNEDGSLLRAVLAPAAVRATDSILRRWKMVQEWSGLDSSILKRGLAEAEEMSKKQLDEAIALAQGDFDRRMSESIETLAHNIVENIAASLLGLGTEIASTPRTAPTVKASPVKSVEPAEEAPVEQPASPKAESEGEDAEEDLGIALDEAYIDTPLCTSCNECVDLNGLVFGYNDNKQAFVKDASAGPYRDLVLAAEKCPVRIIHPGKPLDESEKNLDEWVERAKPFL